MKTFYVFKLNHYYSEIARKEPYNIFVLLNSIYTYKKGDIVIAFDLFNEICLSINKEFFNKYFYDRLKSNEEYTRFQNIHMYHNYFTGEESKMIINISHIKIKSNKDNNIFLENLITGLFVCNFKDSCYEYFSSKSKVKIK